ncbi:MAG: MBL fold metallo-hydrolase [Myxococcota bacterium]
MIEDQFSHLPGILSEESSGRRTTLGGRHPYSETPRGTNGDRAVFRQLFDPETSSYTYLLADSTTAQALLVDPVLEQIDRDCSLLSELGLELRLTLETHLHADHVTASGRLRERLGSQVGAGAKAGVANADRELGDGDLIELGSLCLEVRFTPGHTDGCVTYVCLDEATAFTGDALLIRGCGRTDFQQGDPKALFRSVRERIFSLPEETLLYPGHDYKGRMVTTVAEEKRFNPRLGLDRTFAEFSQIMSELNLAFPRQIDRAVPANRLSGLGGGAEEGSGSRAAPSERRAVAEAMERLGRQDAELWRGMGI